MRRAVMLTALLKIISQSLYMAEAHEITCHMSHVPKIHMSPRITITANDFLEILDEEGKTVFCRSYNGQHLSCLAIWEGEGDNKTIIYQGCYGSQEPPCEHTECKDESPNKFVHSCCCLGPLCNRPPAVEKKPSSNISNLNENPESRPPFKTPKNPWAENSKEKNIDTATVVPELGYPSLALMKKIWALQKAVAIQNASQEDLAELKALQRKANIQFIETSRRERPISFVEPNYHSEFNPEKTESSFDFDEKYKLLFGTREPDPLSIYLAKTEDIEIPTLEKSPLKTGNGKKISTIASENKIENPPTPKEEGKDNHPKRSKPEIPKDIPPMKRKPEVHSGEKEIGNEFISLAQRRQLKQETQVNEVNEYSVQFHVVGFYGILAMAVLLLAVLAFSCITFLWRRRESRRLLREKKFLDKSGLDGKELLLVKMHVPPNNDSLRSCVQEGDTISLKS